jgi:hypothetical protein
MTEQEVKAVLLEALGQVAPEADLASLDSAVAYLISRLGP